MGTKYLTSSDGPIVCLLDTAVCVECLPMGVIIDGLSLVKGDAPEDFRSTKNSHGTQVTQTILAECPSARFFVLKLLDARGRLAEDDRIAAAFEWIGYHLDDRGIALVCAAFADSSFLLDDEAFRGSRAQQAAANLRLRGVPIVAAAGNGFARLGRGCTPGIAWPAILREIVSVGALNETSTLPALHPMSQRLAPCSVTGTRTTVFARPGPPGETSGAAARVTGRLAALRYADPDADIGTLLQRLLSRGSMVMDAEGHSWPAIE